jgi:hypothetical protein
MDERTMDDRDDGRFRRRPNRHHRSQSRRRLATLGNQVVHIGNNIGDRTHAGAPGGRTTRLPGTGSVPRAPGSGGRNSKPHRRPALEGQAGDAAIPTAELELEGALAFPVGEPEVGSGVGRIATMLNITRIHNSLGASGALARGLAWARAYAREREAFGRPLHELPAHRATLTDLAVDYTASLTLALRCCELAGRHEHGKNNSDEAAVLRCLTPVTKLATGRWSIAGVTEAMEAVGGVGCCEDSTIPALVRNTHVLPIWEGTTNVLSLDVLRAAHKSDALQALLDDARRLVVDLVDDARSGETARRS